MAENQKGVKKFTSSEVAAFCEQIAIVLNGGIPLYEGAYMLLNEVEDVRTKEVLKKLDDSLRDNLSFYESLEKTDAFPAYMIYMVRIGEMTGKLEDVMRSLAQYYERDSKIKASIRNVVSYPLTMFVMMAVVLLVLVIKILPMFQNVFEELNADIANSSGNMMGFGLTAGKVIAIVMVVLFVIIFAFIAWYKTSSGKEAIYKFCCKFVFTRKAAEKMAVGKFVSAMSLMISSGMDTKESLELAETVVNHPSIKQKIHECIEIVEKEGALEEALRETNLLSGMQGRMVSIAAKTGVMDVVFEKLSKQYDEEIEGMMNGISSVVETCLVVSLSVVVGAILISVMLPLVSIISSIG